VVGLPRSYADVGKPERRFSSPKDYTAENKAFLSIFQYLRREKHFGIRFAIGSVVVLKTDTYESRKGEVAALSCVGCNGIPAECARCGEGGGVAVAAILPESAPAAQGFKPTAPVANDHLGCKKPSGAKVGADGELHSKHFTSTRNACKLCTPLGACLVYRGVEGCIPFLHGSQGCSTYIRRYLISHFREPMDIASSNFHEDSAIFGGSKNFSQGALNITRQYQPQLIGAATTCLTETIGEDMVRLLHELRQNHGDAAAPIVHVSTPSYRGTHIDGFHAAVKALVEQLTVAAAILPAVEPGSQPGGKNAASNESGDNLKATTDANTSPGGRTPPSTAGRMPTATTAPRINLFPGMVSTADLRHLKEILADFGLDYTLLPDYSESMDGETWEQYEKIQSGGTPLAAIAATGSAKASIEFGPTLAATETAGTSLAKKFGIPRHLLGMPMGIRETDAFFNLLAMLSGRAVPLKYQRERGRLVDSLIDGHKYAFEKRAIVYGDEDLVVGLTAFLCEIGVTPVLCASGGRSKHFEKAIRAAAPSLPAETVVKEGLDFAETAEIAPELKPDFLIGSSKGYKISRSLDVPLIRVGFPIHDRIGGQRVLHLGYRGAQELYDRIVNSLLEAKQDYSTIGYSYL
jgi:nitrogenase molybdenum-iron protein NifN